MHGFSSIRRFARKYMDVVTRYSSSGSTKGGTHHVVYNPFDDPRWYPGKGQEIDKWLGRNRCTENVLERFEKYRDSLNPPYTVKEVELEMDELMEYYITQKSK